MAAWDMNPDWTAITQINNGLEITLGDGFLASDQNKIVENLQFLYNHFSTQHVEVGNVTTSTVPYGTPANVTITSRQADPTDPQSLLYLDFVFAIPEGAPGKTGSFGTPEANASALPPGTQPIVTINASGPDEAKIFNFQFAIPVGETGATGPVGPPGPSVASGLVVIPISESDWQWSDPLNFVLIPASRHGLGQTPNIVAFTYPEVPSPGLGYQETYDSPTIQENGSVLITSNIKWSGRVLLSGGIAESVDMEARAAIDEIQELIPTQASPSNQLADKDFVNSSIQNVSANFVTPDAAGENQWASLAALEAGPWYNSGVSYTPAKSDYAVFLESDNSVWKALYDGTQWSVQYKINDSPFTAEQLAAINSGITATLVESIDTKVDKLTPTDSSKYAYTERNTIGTELTKCSFNADAETIPLRTTRGTIQASDGTQSQDVITYAQLIAAINASEVKIVGRIFASSDALENNATQVALSTLQGVTATIVPKSRDFVLGNGTNNIFLVSTVDVPNGMAYINFFAHATTLEEVIALIATATQETRDWVTANFQPKPSGVVPQLTEHVLTMDLGGSPMYSCIVFKSIFNMNPSALTWQDIRTLYVNTNGVNASGTFVIADAFDPKSYSVERITFDPNISDTIKVYYTTPTNGAQSQTFIMSASLLTDNTVTQQ